MVHSRVGCLTCIYFRHIFLLKCYVDRKCIKQIILAESIRISEEDESIVESEAESEVEVEKGEVDGLDTIYSPYA